MAGHSKWNNIKRRKEAQDKKRAKIFTKISTEIFAAVREQGDDPSTNLRLRTAVQKAKNANVPINNIERTIKRASGDSGNVQYEQISYEGYGPGGVAVFVKTLTDNRNRTVADIRHAFSRNGGNLGEDGCVSFLFSEKGLIVLKSEELDEETVMLEAIEAGAEDVETEDEHYLIWTDDKELEEVREELAKSGYPIYTAEQTMIPSTNAALEGEYAKKMETLIDMLEDNDDVQDVYHNGEFQAG
ncbi:YebC/PmpR family DNA-binding transcriptional regulator [Salicibibacter halophilus]|uniref:Probable transcriptional regulatory protein EPH95_17935 n=1 Tax=Salicibibacter halophilus TaxID=2502791 RepID=A0A514LLT0_9BACI|nr:YebC/PmpR family DNA-binding transcriptional regulator [Salicibibacter halophilus]QDI92817.1 YebC/PmpR family DNA-binding transcriptional regulator [Salicibibacter halophilus]